MNFFSKYRDFLALTNGIKGAVIIKLSLIQFLAVVFEITMVLAVFVFVKAIFSQELTEENVFVYGSILLVYIVFGAIFRLYSISTIYKFSMNIERLISSRLLNSYFSRNYSWHKENSTAELGKTILQDSSQIVSGYILPLMTVLVSLSVILALGVAGLFLAPYLIGGVFGVFFVLVVLGVLLSKPILFRLSLLKEVAAKNRYRYVNEVFNNRSEIYLESKKNQILNELESINNEYCSPQSKYLTVVSTPLQVIEMTILVIIVLSVVISYFISNNFSSTSEVIISLLIVARMLPHINRLSASLSTINYFKGLVNDIISKMKVEKEGEDFYYSDIKEFDSIEFKDAGFYISDKTIFENVNLKIFNGEKILVSGKSGSGKSTFIEVLSGLLNLSKGEYLIDGVHKKQGELLGSLISYVPQNLYLENKNIQEIVLDGGIYNDYCKDVLITLDLLELWDEFSVKNVGENANKLSGGQRQRLGIARALCKDKPIIILDESTSGLDSELECKVLDLLVNKSDKTIIMISHTSNARDYFSKIIDFTDVEGLRPIAIN